MCTDYGPACFAQLLRLLLNTSGARLLLRVLTGAVRPLHAAATGQEVRTSRAAVAAASPVVAAALARAEVGTDTKVAPLQPVA